MASAGTHSMGSKWRTQAGAVAAACRWPHDRHIAPAGRMSVSFDISFSRTASEPAMTGPAHASHGYAAR